MLTRKTNRKHEQFYPAKGRVILHIDMNAFYCSVHEAVEPEKYKGKPTAVAGSVEARKGIVVTSSYPAREKGVRTGMRVREALNICPDLTIILPDFHLYRQFSQKFMEIAYDYSPQIQALSIDECFVDITGSFQFGTPVQIAEEIQRRIQLELHLPCSIGIAPNKLLAKIASDMKKPQGISILRLRDVPNVLWPKPCQSLYGIGAKTSKKLEKLRIYTIGQLAAADEALLTSHFGIYGAQLKQAANGYDYSEVEPVKEQSKSIGHTTTLPEDVTEKENVQRIFLNIADQVARRLRRQKLLCQTVQITIRDPKMKTITRSFTMDTYTEHAMDIYKVACDLFAQHWQDEKPIRLLGITLQNLTSKQSAAVQLDLFTYQDAPKKTELEEVMDKLRDKYGEDAVLTAGMLTEDPSSLLRDYRRRGTSLQMDHLRTKK